MKFRQCLFSIIIAIPLFAGGNWHSFEEGMALAEKSDKHIIIDFYTDWCKWCKVMDQKTFSQPEVDSLLFEKFIPIRLNAESNETVTFQGQTLTYRQLTQAFGVRSFPSLAYLTPNQELITIIPGFIEKGPFLNILKYMHLKCYAANISFEDFLKKGGC
ncbi:MAG TPA: DUF255 domain-containing protein [Candidatus Marinimicrobia bacterium]|nr:DUF255 domain-containing protein [Candidatus Neomarinimicrobiota bacterium]